MSYFRSLFLGWLVWLAGTLAGLPAASGQDFRVDSEIFIGEEKEPAIEALTVFSHGMVYDFLLHAREVTMLDPVRGRFTLLNERHQVKSGISTQELLEFTIDLETHAAQSDDPLFAFAARPEFQTTEKKVERNGQSLVEINLAGKPLVYAAVGQPPQQPEAVRVFRHFADWYARLNATRAGNLPPAARLAVNAALAERGLLPLEITRTFPASTRFGSDIQVKSRHLVNWTLSGEDRRKIDEAGTWLANFKAVSFDEYRNLPQASEPEKQAKR